MAAFDGMVAFHCFSLQEEEYSHPEHHSEPVVDGFAAFYGLYDQEDSHTTVNKERDAYELFFGYGDGSQEDVIAKNGTFYLPDRDPESEQDQDIQLPPPRPAKSRNFFKRFGRKRSSNASNNNSFSNNSFSNNSFSNNNNTNASTESRAGSQKGGLVASAQRLEASGMEETMKLLQREIRCLKEQLKSLKQQGSKPPESEEPASTEASLKQQIEGLEWQRVRLADALFHVGGGDI